MDLDTQNLEEIILAIENYEAIDLKAKSYRNMWLIIENYGEIDLEIIKRSTGTPKSI